MRILSLVLAHISVHCPLPPLPLPPLLSPLFLSPFLPFSPISSISTPTSLHLYPPTPAPTSLLLYPPALTFLLLYPPTPTSLFLYLSHSHFHFHSLGPFYSHSHFPLPVPLLSPSSPLTLSPSLTHSSSPDAIERCMYEFCEDSAAQGVVYSEPRFSPQLASLQKRFSPEEAVQAAIRGLKRGQVDFSIKARIILCMVKGFPIGEWRLCVRTHVRSFKHTHTHTRHAHALTHTAYVHHDVNAQTPVTDTAHTPLHKRTRTRSKMLITPLDE